MRTLFNIVKKLFLLAFTLLILSVVWGRFFNPIITITQIGAVLQYGKLDRDYVAYEDMGTAIKKAVIASEDQNFFSHNGFDYKAIEKAIASNEKGKKLRGGSTISMQTAKNIFLWQKRDYLRKGLEAVFTFIIEICWSKEIILERYLNSIEMGQGVFGIQAASQYYYHKDAKNLSKEEAAMIAAVLPNPKKYDPNNPSPYLKKRQRWIMRQMNYMTLPSE